MDDENKIAVIGDYDSIYGFASLGLSTFPVEGQEDGLIIHGGRKIEPAAAFSYDDHRIAMSLAILGAAGEGVTIERPECVNISYPAFYQTLEELR